MDERLKEGAGGKAVFTLRFHLSNARARREDRLSRRTNPAGHQPAGQISLIFVHAPVIFGTSSPGAGQGGGPLRRRVSYQRNLVAFDGARKVATPSKWSAPMRKTAGAVRHAAHSPYPQRAAGGGEVEPFRQCREAAGRVNQNSDTGT